MKINLIKFISNYACRQKDGYLLSFSLYIFIFRSFRVVDDWGVKFSN